MIQSLALRRFKRFEEETFTFTDQPVLIGPNDTGKTTVLQAIAAWDLALTRWRELHSSSKPHGVYPKQVIARSEFAAVPLRRFDLLWNKRAYRGTVEIGIVSTKGWRVTMELISDSTEQIYVRPTKDTDAGSLAEARLETVFVPPMTGLSTDEPVYQPPKQRQLLGQGKPGEVIRNLLVTAHRSPSWGELQRSIELLFQYRLEPPNDSGAHIVAEYRTAAGSPALDIASAGSGFQQVLMLLTFLYTHRGSVFLLDEPDAHLHMILQQTIYSKLRSVAAERDSQLIISTHSEQIINTVEPKEICLLMNTPRPLVSTDERALAVRSLGMLSNTDIMLAKESPAVLYAEGYPDIELLSAWARVLKHPAHELFAQGIFWKPTVNDHGLGIGGTKARDHFEALKLANEEIRGVELIDGDANPRLEQTPYERGKLQRLRWERYEIESYLFHPEALARFVAKTVGTEVSSIHIEDMQKHLRDTLPPVVLNDPLGDHTYLKRTKARTELIPPALNAAGINLPYTRYAEIAAAMLPEEIHPEVTEKLDAIAEAFGLAGGPGAAEEARP